MPKTYQCLYCYGPCTVDTEGKKIYLVCPKCGKKEATPMLVARLEAREKKDAGR
jgi:transcription elongation factor Elf1